MKDARLLSAAACATLSLALMGASCETVRPNVKAQSDVPSAGKFPHAIFGRFLEKVVQDGLVDYAAASLEEATLEEYLAEVARVSPETHPHLFPTEPDRLAYWINAYNACAIRGVLRFNRPQSLKEIGHKFDSETKYVFGGRELSLNQISVARVEALHRRAHPLRAREGAPRRAAALEGRVGRVGPRGSPRGRGEGVRRRPAQRRLEGAVAQGRALARDSRFPGRLRARGPVDRFRGPAPHRVDQPVAPAHRQGHGNVDLSRFRSTNA